MESFKIHFWTFVLPLFAANVIHMVIVKFDFMSELAIPLSPRLFGNGKTWRGFILLPLLCALFTFALRSGVMGIENYTWSFFIGFILGFAYLLGELPNYYFKRRLGIQSGQTHPQHKVLQFFIDKIDSLVVLCLVYFLITNISFGMILALFCFSFLVHISFSWLLFRLRIKKSI